MILVRARFRHWLRSAPRLLLRPTLLRVTRIGLFAWLKLARRPNRSWWAKKGLLKGARCGTIATCVSTVDPFRLKAIAPTLAGAGRWISRSRIRSWKPRWRSNSRAGHAGECLAAGLRHGACDGIGQGRRLRGSKGL